MIRTIAIIAHDEKLVELRRRIETDAEPYTQRRAFLMKQLDDLISEAEKALMPHLDGIIDHLIHANKMPKDFDRKKHHIHFDHDDGLVLMCDGETHNVMGGFR